MKRGIPEDACDYCIYENLSVSEHVMFTGIYENLSVSEHVMFTGVLFVIAVPLV